MLGKKNADTKMSTLIGAGAELTGDFTLDGSARIDGKIGGNVTVTGNLILGAGSIDVLFVRFIMFRGILQ